MTLTPESRAMLEKTHVASLLRLEHRYPHVVTDWINDGVTPVEIRRRRVLVEEMRLEMREGREEAL